MIKLVRLNIINELSFNLKETPQFIQVILGPRQVGKTTSVLNYLEEEYQAPFVFSSADAVFNATATRSTFQKSALSY